MTVAVAFEFPKNLVYMPVSMSALPLLKRAAIPLLNPEHADYPWISPLAKKIKMRAERVSQKDYEQHLRQEYERLPSTLSGLLSVEQFMAQAEKKRSAIEAALIKHRQGLQEQQGQAKDWLIQHVYPDPYSLAAWQKSGWNRVWLGFDAKQWPEMSLHPVTYSAHLAPSFPQRLLSAPVEQVNEAEQRLIVSADQIQRFVTIKHQEYALMDFPKEALKVLAFGCLTSQKIQQDFYTYWCTDLRFKHIPLVRMYLHPEQYSWQFFSH